MPDGDSSNLYARWLFRADQAHLCWGRCTSTLYDRARKRVELTFESGREVILCFAHSPEDTELDFAGAEIVTVQLRVPLKRDDAYVFLPVDIDGMRKRNLLREDSIGDGAENDCGFVDDDDDTVVVGRSSVARRNE